MVFARVRIISTAFAFCRIPALQRLYTQPAHPHNDIFLIATKKQTTVPSKLGKSKIQVDLVGNETWSTDEFKSLLRLTLRYREANRRISWQNLMHYVLGYTKETCNNQYRLILAQYQNCVSGCEIPDNYKNIVIELKELLKECSVLDEIYRTVTAKWTLEDDQRLLMLLNRGKAWSQIASEMGKFTERQCITRKYRLIDRKKKLDQQLLSGLELHQPLVMGTLPDGTTVALGEIEFIHRKVKKETPIFTKSWTQADDDKLYDLVTQQRRFDYEYLKSYFPEIGYNQMIMALQRISIQRDRGSDMWTKEEEEVLDNLIRKHGKKWTKIAREMPTERTAKQCYDHCRWRSKGTQLKSTIWSEKETILLEVLVELFMQNKLLPLSEQRTRASESTERTLIKLLAPGNSAPIDELQQADPMYEEHSDPNYTVSVHDILVSRL
ncbi:Myb- protein B [Coemansia spiralis]|uniref:Myb- protein B n=1 Tax=Coemansia spiralis TaxID=417178 RepID=A0A9W8G2R9_9FUNG|nr:Myb- protein B [Coemansia sp. RSA 1358]KAJ2672284.1 Myb- protein B [Coemansia spiralis]